MYVKCMHGLFYLLNAQQMLAAVLFLVIPLFGQQLFIHHAANTALRTVEDMRGTKYKPYS